MSAPEITVLPGPDEVAAAAADRLVTVLAQAAAENRRAAIALAGGSTPTAMFDDLARRTRAGDAIGWEAADLYWGDERAVPPDHPDSNYRTARDHLLEPVGLSDHQVHRMPADREDGAAAAEDYARLLRETLPADEAEPSLPVFDLVLLGMGADGHTASLFPGTDAVEVTDRLVVMHPVPAVGMDRMTLTFPVINAARSVVIAVTGASKADRIREVLGPGSDTIRYPVQRVSPRPGRLAWLLDAAAAARLDNG